MQWLNLYLDPFPYQKELFVAHIVFEIYQNVEKINI